MTRPRRAQGPPCRGAFPARSVGSTCFPRVGTWALAASPPRRPSVGTQVEDCGLTKAPEREEGGPSEPQERQGGGEGRGVVGAEGRGQLSPQRVTVAKLESASSAPGVAKRNGPTSATRHPGAVRLRGVNHFTDGETEGRGWRSLPASR